MKRKQNWIVLTWKLLSCNAKMQFSGELILVHSVSVLLFHLCVFGQPCPVLVCVSSAPSELRSAFGWKIPKFSVRWPYRKRWIFYSINSRRWKAITCRCARNTCCSSKDSTKIVFTDRDIGKWNRNSPMEIWSGRTNFWCVAVSRRFCFGFFLRFSSMRGTRSKRFWFENVH